jgi:hypothetical protein
MSTLLIFIKANFIIYYYLHIGMASIMKNYIINELICMESGSNLDAISLNQRLSKFQPNNSVIIKTMSHYMQSLYIDMDEKPTPTIFDVNSSSIIELRGDFVEHLHAKDESFSSFLEDSMHDIITEETDCLLYTIWLEYEKRKKSKKKPIPKSFYFYLKEVFQDHIQYTAYGVIGNHIDDMEYKKLFFEDYQFLIDFFSVDHTDVTNDKRQLRF